METELLIRRVIHVGVLIFFIILDLLRYRIIWWRQNLVLGLAATSN